MLRDCHGSATGVLRECYGSATGLLYGSATGAKFVATRVCDRTASGALRDDCYGIVSGVLREYYGNATAVLR